MDSRNIENIRNFNINTKKALYKSDVIWHESDDKTGSPGPKKLIGGNMEAGFFGEVPSSEFITGKNLSDILGLSAGEFIESSNSWLKFSYLGKIEFISKKPIKHSVSWGYISYTNVVYGGKTITILGKKYSVRLIKGKTEGKQGEMSQIKGSINHNSEWNRLMLPIHKNAPDNWKFKDNVNWPTENWNIGYTDSDLLTNSKYGDGSYTWCQERGEQLSTRLYRGKEGVSYSESFDMVNDYSGYGWRPVLELVE